MLGRFLIVCVIWMGGGIALTALATESENPTPFNVALGALFVGVTTFGNYYAAYGFGKTEEERRPNGKIPLIRRLFFWMAAGMVGLTAIQLPLIAFYDGWFTGLWPAGDLPGTVLTWSSVLATSVALLATAILAARFSKTAVWTLALGAGLMALTDLAAYGFRTITFLPVPTDPFPYWFMAVAFLPFLMLLGLGRIGGDLR